MGHRSRFDCGGLHSGSEYKERLTICSPLITVATSGLWLFVKAVYVDPFVARKAYQANHSYITELLTDAKRYEADVLADPRSTARHKEEVRKKVERLEMALMQAIEDGVTVAEISAVIRLSQGGLLQSLGNPPLR